jgi:lipopolysaccharide/colanic/teichoic acid biosynthesis glycosyltransferase
VTVSNTQKRELARSVDSGCIILAFAGASEIATRLSMVGLFKWPNVTKHGLVGWPPDYVILLVASLVLWAVVGAFTGVYRLDRVESYNDSYWHLGRALLLWIGTMAVAIFFLKLQTVSRQFNLCFFSLASVLIFCRQIAERDLLEARAFGRTSRSAVIVGPPKEAKWLFGVLAARREWYGSVTLADLEEIQTTLNGHSAGEDADSASSNGSFGESKSLFGGTNGHSSNGHSHIANGHSTHNGDKAASDVAEVFLLPGAADPEVMEEWVLRLVKQGRVVHVVPAVIDAKLFRRNLGDVAGVPAITLETSNPNYLEGVVKRVIDATAAAILLLLLSPLMAILGLLVKLTSSGPAIFKQERLGRNGIIFKIFKFRTMRADAEQLLLNDPELQKIYQGNNFKLPEGKDVRITRLGRVLRATSLDELPQLVNVVRGEMSLVGPRPIVPAEIGKYGEYAPLLLSLKPGMTGNWQVNGRSRITEYSERIRLDVEYARDQSAGKDLKILIMTVGAVARMDGAH